MDIETESKLAYYMDTSYSMGEFLVDLAIIDHANNTNIRTYYFHSASSLGVILGLTEETNLTFKSLMGKILDSELSIDDINSIYKGMLEL